MNVYQQISSNKTKSILLFSFFFLAILFLGWVIGEITGFGAGALVIAFILAVLLSFFSYYYSDSIVLKISRAREVKREEFPFLFDIVQAVAMGAGVPKPRLYVINDTAPNAFATGRNPQHSVICVTTGLLQKLDRNELEAVIAHEMSHIKNYDMLVMTVSVVLVGVIVLLSDFILRSFLWGRRGGNSRESGSLGLVLIAIGILFAVLSPFIATIIRLAISRKREFLADADSALMTHNPEALASALLKISNDKEPLEAANKATAHLYIINPLKEHASFMNNLFSTHPPIEARVKALRGM
ncbi:MAG: M48 family metallopeptidase [Candidatus Diapherotrites archaeon]